MTQDPKAARPAQPFLFALITFLAGFAAVIAVHLLLVGLTLLGVEAVSTLRTRDAVYLLASAWCASAGAFAFWGSRNRVQMPRRGIERWGGVFAIALLCMALTAAGIFIERQW